MKIALPNRIPAKGQGGLVAVAITILIALVLAGAGLSGLTYSNAERSVVTKQSLQTYYVAQSGLQEALATRMVPRSNYYNYINPPGNPDPYYPTSGRVFQNPTAGTGLIGVYRYLIVGGDSARDAAGNYLGTTNTPPDVGPNGEQRLISRFTMANLDPFYVVSNAVTCKRDNGQLAPDVITITQVGNGVNINCGADVNGNPTTPDEITLVAEVQVKRESVPAGANMRDRVTRTTVIKTAGPGNRTITLPGGQSTFVPGQGWVANFDFDAAWSHNSTTDTPLRLRRVVFYDVINNTIERVVSDPGTGVTDITALGPVSKRDAIRLYFEGPFDHRSITDTWLFKTNDPASPCKNLASMGQCNIRIKDGGGTYYTQMYYDASMEGRTSILLVPPFSGVAGGTYDLEIDASDMRSYSNAPGPGNYVIRYAAI